MFGTPATTVTAAQAFTAQLRAAVDVALELDVAGLGDGELLDVLRAVEVQKRRLAVLDHRLIAQTEARHVAHEHGCKGTRELLVALLRIDPGEAKAAPTQRATSARASV